MPDLLETPVADDFSDLIPQSEGSDFGDFSDLVPANATGNNGEFGDFSDLVPSSPTSESEKVLAETPQVEPPKPETPKADTGVVHQTLNAVRVFGSAAGKYIFNGLQGLELETAKALKNPPSELITPQAEAVLLPKEQQDALEQQYIAETQAAVPDALARAEYWKSRVETVEEESGVDPALANTVPARLSAAAGHAVAMGMESLVPGAGLPLMVLHGALATEAEAKNAGKTDAEAEQAAVRSAIGLGIFGGASKVAALGVAKLLPNIASDPSKLTTFVSQFVGQGAANETSSRAIGAWEAAEKAKPGEKVHAALTALGEQSLEGYALNLVYAGIGAAKATGARPRGVTEMESRDPEIASRLAEERATSPAIEPVRSPAPETGVKPETARYAESATQNALTLPAIQEAAIRLPDGTIITSQYKTHPAAIGEAQRRGLSTEDFESGFITTSGEFLSNKEALQRARTIRQIGENEGTTGQSNGGLEAKLFQRQKRFVRPPTRPPREAEAQEPAIPNRQSGQITVEPRSPQTIAGESGTALDQPQKRSSYSELTRSEPNAASKIGPDAVPFGFGPGAASAKEPLASYEMRRFGQRFQETEGISPEVREATGNRYYEPIPNKLTASEASKIIDTRGTDEAIRLVRDENFAIEPRVRATLAQTLVQKLNQSHAEATAAGDAVRAKGFLDQAVDTAEYLGEFGTRLGQGVQSFAIWSRLTPEGMLESAKRSAKRAGVELTPEQQTEIRRLSAETQAAPEGIPRQDAAKKLADYMAQQTGIPAKDLPLSIYYTHILSGVNTHVVNAVDTALNVLHEVNNLAVSNPRAAASIYGGLMRGLGEGKYDALLSLQEGRRITSGKFIESPDLLEVSKFGKKGGVPIAVTGKVSGATKKAAESRIAKPLNAYKYVMRMMSASDAVFFRGAEEARAGLLAHRIAESTGVQRRKLKSEVDSILGYDRLPAFREQAAKEGYSGAKAEARATELMIQSRPESLRNEASDYAGVSTYNHEPRGVLGYLSNQVAQIANKYPALKLFVPFTRIVANVTNRGLDNTPLGIYRALKGKGLSKEERQRVLTRGIAGTAGIVGLGVLDATGAIKVHGAGPSDNEKKRQLRNAGWKPFSLQVGDKYYTYTYTPVGLGLSVLGNYLDSQRYNELGQKDSLTRVAYSMSRIGTTVFSQSFLSGLSNLFTILSGDPGRSVNSLKQFFSSTVTAATTPNLIRDVNHVFDPVARKSDGIAQDLVRNIPVARLALKPTLNAFGEPVILSRNRFYSGQSDDPAWRLVVKQNLRVPVVDQTTFEDNDDGYLYAKIAGERMKRYILRQSSVLDRVTPQQAQEMLSKAARSIFDGARQEIVGRGGVKRRKRTLAKVQ